VFVFGDLQTPVTPVGQNPGNWFSITMDLKYLLTGQVLMGKKSFTKRRYDGFFVEFCAKNGTKTPRAEQTNNCFHSANIQSG